MVHHINAIYDHGVLRPIEPLTLPEGARVRLHIEEENGAEQPNLKADDAELPTLLDRMKGFVGTVHNLPPDASVNLDHYLYGMPKRQ
jgi:predicted DNA-binding antitoxin AbrB/MazE fold protein